MGTLAHRGNPTRRSVLLSAACPTSLASEPNIRRGRSGVQMAPACGAAFGGIDNAEPDLIRNQDILRMKDFHHKEIAKKLRDGFRGLREKRKEHNLLFCSPGFWDVGGLLRALSSPG